MMKHDEPVSEKHKLALLQTTSGNDAFLRIGVLEAHGIHVVAIADGVGAVTGEGLSLYPNLEIYVLEEDLIAAKEILDQPVENHESYEWEVYKRTRKKEGWLIGRLLMLAGSIFLAILAYYALQYDEIPMAWVLGILSFLILVVLYFSIDRSESSQRRSERL